MASTGKQFDLEMNRMDYYGPRTNSKSKPGEAGEIGPPFDRFALRTRRLR
jgi:hypothetical protein